GRCPSRTPHSAHAIPRCAMPAPSGARPSRFLPAVQRARSGTDCVDAAVPPRYRAPSTRPWLRSPCDAWPRRPAASRRAQGKAPTTAATDARRSRHPHHERGADDQFDRQERECPGEEWPGSLLLPDVTHDVDPRTFELVDLPEYPPECFRVPCPEVLPPGRLRDLGEQVLVDAHGHHLVPESAELTADRNARLTVGSDTHRVDLDTECLRGACGSARTDPAAIVFAVGQQQANRPLAGNSTRPRNGGSQARSDRGAVLQYPHIERCDRALEGGVVQRLCYLGYRLTCEGDKPDPIGSPAAHECGRLLLGDREPVRRCEVLGKHRRRDVDRDDDRNSVGGHHRTVAASVRSGCGSDQADPRQRPEQRREHQLPPPAAAKCKRGNTAHRRGSNGQPTPIPQPCRYRQQQKEEERPCEVDHFDDRRWCNASPSRTNSVSRDARAGS